MVFDVWCIIYDVYFYLVCIFFNCGGVGVGGCVLVCVLCVCCGLIFVVCECVFCVGDFFCVCCFCF